MLFRATDAETWGAKRVVVMVVVTQAVVAVVNVGVAMETEGVVFVKNNTCVADLGGDNGLWVNVDLKFGGIIFVVPVCVEVWTGGGVGVLGGGVSALDFTEGGVRVLVFLAQTVSPFVTRSDSWTVSTDWDGKDDTFFISILLTFILSTLTNGNVWLRFLSELFSLAFRVAPIFCALLIDGGISFILAFVGTESPIFIELCFAGDNFDERFDVIFFDSIDDTLCWLWRWSGKEEKYTIYNKKVTV